MVLRVGQKPLLVTETVMPYALSAPTFSRQAKLLVQHWPFQSIKLSYAREVLSQLYGYKNHHHYQQLTKNDAALLAIDAQTVLSHYTVWVKRLADLGSMNQIQARQLIHYLWPNYLNQQVDLHQKLYQAQFRFLGDCADFIDNQYQTIPYHFDDRPAIKDAIEAIGIPHPEVGGICVNGQWVDFSYLLMNGDQVEVYSQPCLTTTKPLPYKPNGRPVFLLDVHLGGLARYLRMAGFDCLHQNQDYGDAVLAEVAANHDYILLSRDLGLLKRNKVKYGRWVRAVLPEQQFKEIVSHYQLKDSFLPFSRCIKCNGQIAPVDKKQVQAVVPEKVYASLNEFRQCQSCHQVYWQGTHYQKIIEILNNVA